MCVYIYRMHVAMCVCVRACATVRAPTCTPAVHAGGCKEVAVQQQLCCEAVAQGLWQPEDEHAVHKLWVAAQGGRFCAGHLPQYTVGMRCVY